MADVPFDWHCPFCHQPQVVTRENHHRTFHKISVGKSTAGDVGLVIEAIRCVSPRCNELTLTVSLWTAEQGPSNWYGDEHVMDWRLLPDSVAKHQPDYIPEPLREDYYEACLIREKSPKASATLARRCLQGMIRDFCGISKRRLVDEINELRSRVDSGSAPKGVGPETIDAIDAIRNVGNIGAHMEGDISVIIEVDPGEAQALIDLIEMLFAEWYVARHVRDERLARVKLIAAEKQAAIQAGKARQAQSQLSAIDNASEPS